MKTTIPFQGFYYSVHDENLDYALESIFSDDNGNKYESLCDLAFESIKWSDAHRDYAKAYTQLLAEKFDLKIKFKLLSSPRFYNFETDRIVCDISKTEVKRIYKKVDKTVLAESIKKRFTSRDGFISFYPSKLEAWPKDLSQWDVNHVGTLLEVYIQTHEDYSDAWEEAEFAYELSEKSSQIINEHCTNERCWKILNYLHERSMRKYRPTTPSDPALRS